MGDQQLHMLAYNGPAPSADDIVQIKKAYYEPSSLKVDPRFFKGNDGSTNKNNNSSNNDHDSTNKDYTIYLIGGGALVLF